MATEIHPTAVVSPGAELGTDVTVGAFTFIGGKVKIGDRSKIGPHVVIEGDTTIGQENEISPFVSLGGIPQDLKYRGEASRLLLGDRNKVREFVTMHIGTATGRMETKIGNTNLFMANSHVAHDCLIGDSNVFANSVALAGHVRIFDHVILGGLAGVHQFCRVGSYAIASAGSMMGADVPPYAMVQGDRARLRGLNVVGLRRAGMNQTEVAAIKRAYRHFFSTLGHYEEKLGSLPEDLAQHVRVQPLKEFLAEPAKRGYVHRASLEGGSDESLE